ncbi:MAG: GNAT family N-acetyltransferase [Anaerolineae bacterium]|nr:GNAT family N-acetyltransferase [Anaerolineae bacterium]
MSSSTQAQLSQGIQVRPARAEDFEPARALTLRIWEDDYIPHVWERWLADPEGALVVAVVGGQVVGFSKLTRLGPDEWWFEGLRVDPAHQRRGVARAMSDHLLARFRALGGGLGRWATASSNVAVHRMASAQGFKRQAAFAPYEARPQPLFAEEFRALTPGDAPRIWDYLSASPYFEANARSYAVGWTWYLLTETRLVTELEAGRVYGWFGDPRADADALGGVVMVCEPDTDRAGNPRLRVAYFDVTEGSLAVAAQALRAVAGEMGVSKVTMKPLVVPEHFVALEQAGYRRAWEQEAWLYALDERG